MEEAFRKPKRKAGNGLFVFFVFFSVISHFHSLL
jgi:hypothetical protein